jgi:hypothetical protein
MACFREEMWATGDSASILQTFVALHPIYRTRVSLGSQPFSGRSVCLRVVLGSFTVNQRNAHRSMGGSSSGYHDTEIGGECDV